MNLTEMDSGDMVEVVVIFRFGGYTVLQRTLKEASDLVRGWYNCREAVYHRKEGWEETERWLDNGVMVLNHKTRDGVDVAFWAFCWRDVTAMYIRPVMEYHQEVLAKAQKKIADVMERESRKVHEGDEWRGEEDV